MLSLSYDACPKHALSVSQIATILFSQLYFFLAFMSGLNVNTFLPMPCKSICRYTYFSVTYFLFKTRRCTSQNSYNSVHTSPSVYPHLIQLKHLDKTSCRFMMYFRKILLAKLNHPLPCLFEFLSYIEITVPLKHKHVYVRYAWYIGCTDKYESIWH